MIEYVTEAVVLDKEPVGETDVRVFLYTRHFGKVAAKAKSARKIISKLNSHLEPLNLVQVRLVEKNGLQVADALRFGRLPEDQLRQLRLIHELTPEFEADAMLWSAILSRAGENVLLKILGFDGQFAVCGRCGDNQGLVFLVSELNYFCGHCYNNK